jgi:hypothetical protein
VNHLVNSWLAGFIQDGSFQIKLTPKLAKHHIEHDSNRSKNEHAFKTHPK